MRCKVFSYYNMNSMSILGRNNEDGMVTAHHKKSHDPKTMTFDNLCRGFSL